MANADVVARMNRLLDAYEKGELRAEEVERGIQFLMEALEELPYQKIKDADHLCCRWVSADLCDGGEQFIDSQRVATVMLDFRTFIASLPRRRKVAGDRREFSAPSRLCER